MLIALITILGVKEQEILEATSVPIDSPEGTWTCGVDIAPGRYIATPTPDSE